MSEEIKLSIQEASTHDAQLIAENIEEGKEKSPSINLDADYQAAQQLSTNRNAQTEEGKKALEEKLAPKFQLNEPEKTEVETQVTGNPEDYLKMADEISLLPDAVGNVSDELMAKALKMGQSGQ
jgi:hypothetical protein